MSMQEFSSSEAVLLDDSIAQTCWMGEQNERIKMLGRAVSSLSNSPKEVACGSFEIEVRDGELHISFAMTVFYCCNIPDARDISAARCGAERGQPYVRCHNIYEDRVSGRKGSG